MEYRPSKKNHYKKKKCVKYCCGNTVLRRLPYVTIADKTEGDDTGSPFLISPQAVPTILWTSVDPTSLTCLNGNLKSCFDVPSGVFTVKESGLYHAEFSVATIADLQGSGFLTVRILRILADPSKRCANNITGPANTSERTLFITVDTSLQATVSAPLPLVVGDTLQFQVTLGLTGITAPNQPVIAEINIVQLTRLDKGKIEDTAFV